MANQPQRSDFPPGPVGDQQYHQALQTWQQSIQQQSQLALQNAPQLPKQPSRSAAKPAQRSTEPINRAPDQLAPAIGKPAQAGGQAPQTQRKAWWETEPANDYANNGGPNWESGQDLYNDHPDWVAEMKHFRQDYADQMADAYSRGDEATFNTVKRKARDDAYGPRPSTAPKASTPDQQKNYTTGSQPGPRLDNSQPQAQATSWIDDVRGAIQRAAPYISDQQRKLLETILGGQ